MNTLNVTYKNNQKHQQGTEKLNPNSIGGGGQFGRCDAKSREKCPCWRNNYTGLIKQISQITFAKYGDQFHF